MAPKRRCPVCGSRRWRKSATSGLITCSEGHVLQNYRVETTEVDEFGPHARIKRKLHKQSKKKEHSGANPNLYYGERGRYHYFQCLQLILRMQVAALTKAWGLPPQFETVCRDVWTLHLSLLPNPPPAEPLYFAEDRQDAKPAEDTLGLQKSSPPEDPESKDHAEDKQNDLGNEEDDPEMAKLMRENSETPLSSEDETTKVHLYSRRKQLRKMYDTPASNIAVLMVACWTLRLPVMYMDFIRLIEAYKLPYLEPLRFLPVSMTSHLTKSTSKALSPSHAPRTLDLHNLTSRLAKLMYAKFEVYTPEMNATPTLWRAVRALQGNPTLYTMTKKVARMLSIPVMLHRSLAAPLQRLTKEDATWRKYDSAVPEVSLIATVIVVLKMVYGLDGKDRSPKERDDPACALPRLPEYLACIEQLDETTPEELRFTAASQISVLDMDAETLDQYLEFCETALLPREDRRAESNVVMQHFPLQENHSLTNMQRLQQEITLGDPQPLPATLPALALREDECLRPGDSISIYNNLDVLGDLPEQYELVVRRAAHWAGVDEDYVSGVVERYERRIMSLWKRTRTLEARGGDE
ncbi:hypothetical protein WOLCODRAFT_118149 [Wolfiporia cocos MD-104 SS10]|uniref:RRN7-type domain-containing protein n=1 Tax=Wolfiporia cocos (strain MD-104) TaxID=742152 RepID=A0A2H3JFT2_WOLCO|nr:hypothetical protein WOLCODRAFT_118149 [Wolfiporia cocos MD-104 SS10]